jgi:hypothetical protein
VDTLLLLLPQTLLVPYLLTRPTLMVILALAILPLSLPTSMSAKRVILATWTSVGTYILWLGCVSYAHGKGSLTVNPVLLRRSGLWDGISQFPCPPSAKHRANHNLSISCYSFCIHIILHPFIVRCPQRIPPTYKYKNRKIPLI